MTTGFQTREGRPAVPARRHRRLALLTALLSLLLFLPGCGDKEPAQEGRTLQHILSNGTLRVGVIESPPWAKRGLFGPGGVESKTIKQFARSMNIRPVWYYLPAAEAFSLLGAQRLDIVIGGLTTDTALPPGTIATPAYFTAPDETAYVMALQYEESRFRLTLSRYLQDREQALSTRLTRIAGR